MPGVVFKHFTAQDILSRWRVLEAHSQATTSTAAHFLNNLQEGVSFPIGAIPVDGGLQFEAVFEEECQRHNIKLFILPPRSPKLNGGIERAHRTHTEELYEADDYVCREVKVGKISLR